MNVPTISSHSSDENISKTDWVQRYFTAGWRAFAVVPNGKNPMRQGWQQATVAEALSHLAAYHDANIGTVPPPGHFVLDVDRDGDAVLSAFEIENGPLPDTLTATTWSGGRHLVFSLPPGEDLLNAVRFAQGLDVRMSGKGYIVVEPSTIDGAPYKWGNWGMKPAPSPQWLIQAIKAGSVKDKAQADPDTQTPEGSRNATLTRKAGAMRNAGFVEAEISAALTSLNDRQCRPPLPASEVAAIAKSVMRYPAAQESWGVGFGQSPLPPGAMPITPRVPNEPERSKRVSLGDLFSNPPAPQRFLIDKILPCGVLTLLGAHGGAGKSMLALTAAVCLVTGRPFFGKTVEKCRVLFFSGEDPESVVRPRLARIARHMGVDLHELAAGLMMLDATENPILYNGAGTSALDALRLDIADSNPGAIIIDNASDAYDANEIERARVREFIRLLAALGKGRDAAVLLLAHVDKNTARDNRSSEGYSGSTAWHNSARSRLFLSSKEGRLTLEHQKSNLGIPSEPIYLAWTTDGLLIQADAPGSFDDLALVLRLLTEAYERGSYVSVAQNSPNNPYAVLSPLPGFPKGLNKEGLKVVMSALEVEGAIMRETIKGPDRHPRNIYRPAAANAGSARDVLLPALITDTPAPAGGVC